MGWVGASSTASSYLERSVRSVRSVGSGEGKKFSRSGHVDGRYYGHVAFTWKAKRDAGRSPYDATAEGLTCAAKERAQREGREGGGEQGGYHKCTWGLWYGKCDDQAIDCATVCSDLVAPCS